MPIWERYDRGNTLVAAGFHVNDSVLLNEEDTDNFQNADIVIVDGIVTVVTDTDDLVGVRLMVIHNSLASADINEDAPKPHEPQVYYSWYCARGPLVFRLRSKKTIPPGHRLWLQTWKAQGGNSTVCRVGLHLFMQLKH